MKNKKVELELESNQILNLFVSGSYKLPFSSQPNLVLYVHYSEYVEFIRWLCVTELPLPNLLFDLKKYKEYLISYDRGSVRVLESAFAYDLLTACIRELNISQVRYLQPTHIIAVFNKAEYTVEICDIDKVLPELIKSKPMGVESLGRTIGRFNRHMCLRLDPEEMDKVSREFYNYCLLLGFTYYSSKNKSIINIQEERGESNG